MKYAPEGSGWPSSSVPSQVAHEVRFTATVLTQRPEASNTLSWAGLSAVSRRLTAVLARNGFGSQVRERTGARVGVALGSAIATLPAESVLMRKTSGLTAPKDAVDPATT